MRQILLGLMSLVLLSACCAPGLTHVTPTAFKATVISSTATSSLVKLDNGQTLELVGVSATLIAGQRYYIQGDLLPAHSVDVTSVSQL